MKITFLIGNGFDIGIGLKTRYEDFYQKYCNITNEDNDNIKAFKEMLQKRNSEENRKIINWADFETAFGQHSKDFTIEEKGMYLERFEDFISKFNIYLEKEEAVTDYSNEALISETMKSAINTYFHIQEESKGKIQQIYNRNKAGTIICNFISFNYTRTIDNCVNILSKTLDSYTDDREVGKIVHIHGYIDKNMIMGVNDPTQITNEKFSADNDIIHEIVKPQQNVDCKTGYEREVKALINNSDIICVYGMSIGVTDKKWWNIISKWLSDSESRGLIILKHELAYDPRFPHIQRRITDKVVNVFLSYSELSADEKTKISSRIYVGCNHNVFSMELRKKEQSNIKRQVIIGDSNTLEAQLRTAKEVMCNDKILDRIKESEKILDKIKESDKLLERIAGGDLSFLR